LLRGAAEAAAAEVEADLAAAEAELEAARAAQREAAGEEDVISPAHAFQTRDDQVKDVAFMPHGGGSNDGAGLVRLALAASGLLLSQPPPSPPTPLPSSPSPLPPSLLPPSLPPLTPLPPLPPPLPSPPDSRCCCCCRCYRRSFHHCSRHRHHR